MEDTLIKRSAKYKRDRETELWRFKMKMRSMIGPHWTIQREKHPVSFIWNVFSSILQQSLNLQICLFYTFLFIYMPTKNYFRKKAIKLCKRGQIVIKSHIFLKYWQNREIHVKESLNSPQIVSFTGWNTVERWTVIWTKFLVSLIILKMVYSWVVFW